MLAVDVAAEHDPRNIRCAQDVIDAVSDAFDVPERNITGIGSPRKSITIDRARLVLVIALNHHFPTRDHNWIGYWVGMDASTVSYAMKRWRHSCAESVREHLWNRYLDAANGEGWPSVDRIIEVCCEDCGARVDDFYRGIEVKYPEVVAARELAAVVLHEIYLFSYPEISCAFCSPNSRASHQCAQRMKRKNQNWRAKADQVMEKARATEGE